MEAILPGKIIGIIGGGQLGRMTALAASNLGYKTHIFCPPESKEGVVSPAAQVSSSVTYANYDDVEALKKFVSEVDVVSFEFENIPYETLLNIEKLIPVRPNPKALHIAQNRIREKDFLNEIGAPTTAYRSISNAEDLINGYKELDNPKAILKTVELGYDGKGQVMINPDSDLKQIWEESQMGIGVLEEFVNFSKEISVVIARGIDGESLSFPPAENVHVKGILDTSTVPADITPDLANKACEIAKKIADGLDLIGILAVEFFVDPDKGLLVNEMAPRPHNSGHWSMDGAVTSQFEQFIRAICGLELGVVDAHSNVRMLNLIGDDVEKVKEIVKDPSAKLHLYGKAEVRAGRKMGHVNFVSPKV